MSLVTPRVITAPEEHEPLAAAEQTAGQLDACGIEAQLSQPHAQNAGWQCRVSLAQVCQNGLLPG